MDILKNNQTTYNLPINHKLYSLNINKDTIYVRVSQKEDLLKLNNIKLKVKQHINKLINTINNENHLKVKFIHQNKLLQTLIRATGN